MKAKQKLSVIFISNMDWTFDKEAEVNKK